MAYENSCVGSNYLKSIGLYDAARAVRLLPFIETEAIIMVKI